MRTKIYIIRGVCSLFIFGVLLFVPLLFTKVQFHEELKVSVNDLSAYSNIVIFGTLVDPAKPPSPLLKQRLTAGFEAYKKTPGSQIVVSNMPAATPVMTNTLIELGVSKEDIIEDLSGEKTSDTCRFLQKNDLDGLLFVSQSFHLYRIFSLCSQQGVNGQGLAAEQFFDPSAEQSSTLEKWSIRIKRYTREAVLMWLDVFGLYEKL